VKACRNAHPAQQNAGSEDDGAERSGTGSPQCAQAVEAAEFSTGKV
jgi:hypothetical protein